MKKIKKLQAKLVLTKIMFYAAILAFHCTMASFFGKAIPNDYYYLISLMFLLLIITPTFICAFHSNVIEPMESNLKERIKEEKESLNLAMLTRESEHENLKKMARYQLSRCNKEHK